MDLSSIRYGLVLAGLLIITLVVIPASAGSSLIYTPPTFVTEWGSLGSDPGQFYDAQGIAVSPITGNVYVSDNGNNRIQEFTSNGTFITQWGSEGSDPGQFEGPAGIAVDPNTGNVYVADYCNGSIQEFTQSGTHIGQWNTYGFDPNEGDQWVAGLAFGPNGNLYATLTARNEDDGIQEYTPSGGFVAQFSSRSLLAYAIAVNASGYVYVPNYDHVEVYAPSGAYLTQWGSLGIDPAPAGIVIDANGDIYVGDPGHHQILKYTSDGTVVNWLQWWDDGNVQQQFNYPEEIAIGPNGHMYVCDMDRIIEFSIAPTVTEVSPAYGSSTGDTSVTITGNDFIGASKVNFGTTETTDFTVNSDGSITVTSPPETAGVVNITVTTPYGTSVTSSADKFTYMPGAPTVTGISPASGIPTGGTNVTITGTGFFDETGSADVNAVYFGTMPATNVTAICDSSINVTAPAGTGKVDVTVATNYGTSATSSADQFTYKLSPTFTFAPSNIRTTDIVTFDASQSVDPTQDTILWDFGDGTTDTSGNAIVNHSYSNVGSYTATLTVTDSSGIPSSSTHVINVTIPVVLVHGFFSSSATWNSMTPVLQQAGFEVWNFDYQSQNTQDPRTIVPLLSTYIDTQRNDLTYNGQKYNGKIDIVCHSMGALVSRLYMENYLAGIHGNDVRQWIGIAPAQKGSAAADTNIARIASSILPALTQLRTDSPSVNALILGMRSPTTKYRVIDGYNPTHSLNFGQDYINLSATLALNTSAPTPYYYWTYDGDMIVATAQSYDPSMGFDAFPLGGNLNGEPAVDFDHIHITQSPQVIATVLGYLENVNIPSSNIVPKDTEIPYSQLTLWQRQFVDTPADYYPGGFTVLTACPVDITITDPDGQMINKQINEIPGATYTELAPGSDGTPDAMIVIPNREVGDYLITVTPKSGASSTDTFTLQLLSNITTNQTIASNVPINNIPSNPYDIRVTSDGSLEIITSGEVQTPAAKGGHSAGTDYWVQSGNTESSGYTGSAPTQVKSSSTPAPMIKPTVNDPITVAATQSPVYVPPPLPTNTPKSGIDAVPVLGALGLCGAVFLFRKNRN